VSATDWERALAARVTRYEHGSRVPGWDDAVDLDRQAATIPELIDVAVSDELRAAIEAAMAKYPDRRSAVIPALHLAQDEHGWCSPLAIDQVAAVMRLTPGYVSSIATFYDMFNTVPVGSNTVYVCTNISCSLCGADELYEAMLDAAGDDPAFNVRSFECLGACDMAPMAAVNGDYVGPLTVEDTREIVAACREGREVLPAKSLRRRASTDPNARRGRTDTAGLRPEGDRPGPPAAFELTQDEEPPA
jgi:NADH-quinone oxidoreductase subunit E